MSESNNTNYIVYCHECIPNGKKYYGITKDAQKRWGNNGSGYYTNRIPGTVFENAIRKYGWDNFKHIVLHQNLSRTEACRLEQEYIANDKTNVTKYGTKYGYNMTDGGDGASGCPLSDETRRKMSLTRKAIGIPPEVSKLGNRARMTPVVCIETNEYFESIHDAARTYKTNPSNIADCLYGLSKTSMFMHWRYADDTEQGSDSFNKLNDKERAILMDRYKVACTDNISASRSAAKSVPVYCEDLDRVFCSGVQAEKDTGISHKCISLCVRGKTKTAGGYRWRYA